MGRREWVADLAEYRQDRDAYEQLELPDWLVSQNEWRLIVPVLLRDRLLGIMLLRNPPSGFELTFEDRDLLKTVARHVATHLAQFDSERRLAESRQFEAYSRLSAFLMHDLKNSVAQLNLVVTNAARHKSNPAFIDDAVETVANTASRMTRLIEQLQRGEANGRGERVALESAARTAVQRSQGREPRPALIVEHAGLDVSANEERLVNVLEHLIRNAQDATPGSGRVTIKVASRGRTAVVDVNDTGQGMSAEFIRERLFRPFDSTKGARGMGIGAYQAREYARALGGDVEVESTPGQGTVFRIILPMPESPTAA
jgi:putative PEP-CTERM system histidine kinase